MCEVTGGKLFVANSKQALHQYGNFDMIFLIISCAVLSSMPPHTRRAVCSIY